MTWRARASAASVALALIAAVGTHQHRAQVADMPVDLGASKALVDDEDLAGPEAGSVQQGHGDLALAQLGAGQAPGDRAAIRVVRTYSLSPQYQREWLGHQP